MLDKRSKRILVIFGIALLVLVITETVRPKEINWSPSYTSSDKIPFGGYVLYEELPSLFNNKTLETVSEDPYVFLQDSTNYKENSAYLFINNYVYFDATQTETFLNYVSKGNTAFMSASSFGYILEDSLQVSINTNYTALEEELKPTLFSTSFTPDSLPKFKRGLYKTTFSEIDTLQTKALGYFTEKDSILNELNFVKVGYGEGKIYLHTVPEAFSNYYLLRDSQEYAAGILSYIEADHIYLDAYMKSGRKIVESPMRFVLSQGSLKWAIYLLLASLLLFVLFRSKREQRIIEVVEPLENSSIEFTKTIGDLYFQHKDYGNIIAKKITYFLEFIRTNYYLDTNELDDNFIKKLASKSGSNIDDTKKLINTVKHFKEKVMHTEADLISLNKLIEAFTK
ncbi:DUF4350 domain-containing protein [Patiriisocius hiemis]|uniref:DUF4350 domain-containing protein n=1 Tax=Patiriisocius hiemis TaxID=3075604 RepID=A0ABU2YH46_9FLAO|nr:DUF4350 domain-containing protein [Constantimarinum sp. W242]MDT0556585.1 DUF4350 domain-containing protein [Constantimarinum sp. W242]